MNLDNLTINQRIKKAGIKQYKTSFRGYRRTVMEYNRVCVLRPYIGWLEDVNEVTTAVFGISI